MSETHPLADVSVITVVRNDRDGLRRTAASVLAQRGCTIEYIVVDGASTDGTVEEIEALGDAIARWESRRDDGIYDAMNRGAALATAPWVLYLNAGDTFAASDAAARLYNAATADVDIVYGDHCFREPDGRLRQKRARTPAMLWRGMIASHQSMLVRRPLCLQHPYDPSLRIAGDFAFFAELQRAGARWRGVPATIALMERGGVSDVRRFASLREWRMVARSLAPAWKVEPYYAWRVLREIAQLPLRWRRARMLRVDRAAAAAPAQSATARA